MATLVGSLSVVVTGTTQATPTWGSGQTRAVGNLLTIQVTSYGANAIGTPTGWAKVYATDAVNGSLRANILWRKATGGDAAPAVTGGATQVAVQANEWSDPLGWPASPAEHWGDQNSTASQSACVATIDDGSSATPSLAGSLVLGVYLEYVSTARAYAAVMSAAQNLDAANLMAYFPASGTSGNYHHMGGYGLVTAADLTTSMTGSMSGTARSGTWAAKIAIFKPNPPPQTRTLGAPSVVTAAQPAAVIAAVQTLRVAEFAGGMAAVDVLSQDRRLLAVRLTNVFPRSTLIVRIDSTFGPGRRLREYRARCRLAPATFDVSGLNVTLDSVVVSAAWSA